jgi:NAD-dependent dihydropyrimidine dehydrogenase PreA subunit
MEMSKYGRLKVVSFFVIMVAAVILFSSFFAGLWGGKEGESKEPVKINMTADMTVEEFGKVNNLSNELLKEVFSLTDKKDLEKTINQTGISTEQVLAKVKKEKALHEEFKSKNWFLIPLKFALWIVFLVMVFVLIRKRAITARVRKILYFAAFVLFGVILGSDPSPMGTVKDAIVLLGTSGVIFPPRMIALAVFLLTVFLANRFICSWGCQLGTFQDAIFRINRGEKDRRGIFPQIKLPLAITNTIRIITFAALAFIAFVWGLDMIGAVDPFKMFKPSVVAVYGWVFIGALLIASLFIYRPWCHLFCPFGLIAWIVEKMSVFKIQVNYDTCSACEKCVQACPSSVMEGILKRDRIVPDCFSCATCIEVCPTKSISFKAGKRRMPPPDKYNKNKE